MMDKTISKIFISLSLVMAISWTTLGTAHAYSWGDWITTTEGGIVDFTLLKSVSPSYFYNAFSGRSEVGATTQVLWVGKFVSADVGYSVPRAEGGNQGTVILGGNLHIDRLIASSFPDQVELIQASIPAPARKFWNALNLGLYVGHDTINKELAGGVYSSMELKF